MSRGANIPEPHTPPRVPEPTPPKPTPRNDKVEETLKPIPNNEIEDEFLVNNLVSEAHGIIDNIAGMIMKTSFKDVYKHPIDYERFMQEHEWEDDLNCERQYPDEDSPQLDNSADTISSKMALCPS